MLLKAMIAIAKPLIFRDLSELKLTNSESDCESES